MATRARPHAHFIGIAGIAMSAVALLLKEQGWSVSGSDEHFYPPSSEILPANGIAICTPFAAANIPPDTALFVIGKHATLTEKDNAEVAAAYKLHREQGIPIQSYPEALASLTEGRDRLMVCGSFGKSSTASIIAWSLVHAGVDAGYMIGARANNLRLHAHLGAASPFVMEGDEYPSSNTDPRAKFLHYRPHTAVLTSAQHDHVNIFPTHEDYLRPFRQLLSEQPASSLLAASSDDEFALALSKKTRARVVTYGLSPASDYSAANVAYGAVTTFTLRVRGRDIARLETTQLGAHTVQNILGAAAALFENELVTPEQFAAAIAAYTGVKRRLDRLTFVAAVPVYEGFGSSADKARSAIAAIRLHFPDRRLVAVFEPHTFSWRNRATLHWYDSTFDGVDDLFVYPPPETGAASHEQLSQADIVDQLRRRFEGHTYALKIDLAANLAAIRAAVTPDCVVLLLTSADLGGLIEPLVESLEGENASMIASCANS